MTRRRRRLVIALALLAILIALLSVAYINYRATRNIGFGLDLNTGASSAQPEFMYSFGRYGREPALKHPLGVLV